MTITNQSKQVKKYYNSETFPSGEKPQVQIFDTTQRDGMQTPRIRSWTTEQHRQHAIAVVESGVSMIEAGFAAAGPNIQEQIRQISMVAQEAQIFSLARANINDIDAACEALKNSKNPAIHTFYATSKAHLKLKYGGKTQQQALDKIAESILYAKDRFETVMFSPEDATNTSMRFLYKVCKEAELAGAKIINIPDTLGKSTPGQYGKMIAKLTKRFPNMRFSVHGHNDLGMGTGIAMSAIESNKSNHPIIIQGAFGGIGERAGNTAIEQIVTACQVHGITTDMDPKFITSIVNGVYSNIGWEIPKNKPIVGANAFAHTSGIHAAAVEINPTLYNPFPPELVGAGSIQTKLNEQSGSNTLFAKMAKLGIEVANDQRQIIFDRFKALAIGKTEVYTQELYLLTSPEEFRSTIKDINCNISSTLSSAEITITQPSGETITNRSVAEGTFKAIFEAINKSKQFEQNTEPTVFEITSEGTGPSQDAIVYIEIEAGEIKVSGRSKNFDTPQAVAKAYLECIDKINAIQRIKNPPDQTTGQIRYINASF
jgi:2-isopropylmalate synthase